MRYRELMESGDSSQSLASKILDLLTPLASNGIESITMDNLVTKVQRIPSGLQIDKEVLIDILDPNKFPIIKKIEGDLIYFKQPELTRSVTDKQKETEADTIKSTAEKQAVKNIKSD